MNLYVIIDRKAQACVSVFTSLNSATAARSFIDLVNSPDNNVFNQHPGDFAVYSVGSVFVRDNRPVIIGAGFDFASDDNERYKFAPKLDNVDLVFDGSELSPEVILSNRLKAAESRAKILQIYQAGNEASNKSGIHDIEEVKN